MINIRNFKPCNSSLHIWWATKKLKKVAQIAKANGFTDIYQQSLPHITKLEKVMGKKKFDELLGPYIYKTAGKLTLVPNSDKRSAVDTTNAQDEFTEV